MVSTSCAWCDMQLKRGQAFCPECGLASPENLEVVYAPRGHRHVLVTMVGIGVTVSGTFAVYSIKWIHPVPRPAQVAPAVSYRDATDDSVWRSAQLSVRLLLHDQSYSAFDSSFLSLSAGNILAVCGEIDGTSGFDSTTGEERYVSVFGQTSETVRETGDQSFDVLWRRLCSGRVAAG